MYAFDSATGAQKWFQPTVPAGRISAGNGMVYLFEEDSMSSNPHLVARRESDGSIAWSVAVQGINYAYTQAPVLAQGRVICLYVHRWGGNDFGVRPTDRSPGLDCSVSVRPNWMAAALGSSTLVVGGGPSFLILRLADGSTVWTGPVSGVGYSSQAALVGNRIWVGDGVSALRVRLPVSKVPNLLNYGTE